MYRGRINPTRELLREVRQRVPSGTRLVPEAFITDHRRPVLEKLSELTPETFYLFDEITAQAFRDAVMEVGARDGGGRLTVCDPFPVLGRAQRSTVCSAWPARWTGSACCGSEPPTWRRWAIRRWSSAISRPIRWRDTALRSRKAYAPCYSFAGETAGRKLRERAEAPDFSPSAATWWRKWPMTWNCCCAGWRRRWRRLRSWSCCIGRPSACHGNWRVIPGEWNGRCGMRDAGRIR